MNGMRDRVLKAGQVKLCLKANLIQLAEERRNLERSTLGKIKLWCGGYWKIEREMSGIRKELRRLNFVDNQTYVWYSEKGGWR